MGDLTPFAKLPRGLAPLGYRDFSLYWVGAASSATGRWIELTGLLWLVYELTSSPFLVGLLGAARAFPALLLSPIAGVIADRLNHRIVLMATQVLSMLCSLAMGVLVLAGVVEPWHIYLQVIVQAAVNNLDSSIRQAMFPRLVPRAILTKAITLTITGMRVAKTVGPAVGGLLIAGFGVAAPFFAASASFLLLVGAVLAMRPAPPLRETGSSSFRTDLVEGLRYILSVPVLRGLLKLELVFGLFELNPAIIAIIGREILDVGPSQLGILLAAPALGSFVGIGWLLLVERPPSRQGRFTLRCTMSYAFSLGILSLLASYSLIFVALAAIGALEVLMTITRNSIMQLAAPENMRGRIMANMGMITRGFGPMGETQSGVLASVLGPGLAVATAAAAIGAAAGLTALRNRALWQFSIDHMTAPAGRRSTQR